MSRLNRLNRLTCINTIMAAAVLFCLFVPCQVQASDVIPPPLSAEDIPGESVQGRQRDREMIPDGIAPAGRATAPAAAAPNSGQVAGLTPGWSDLDGDRGVDRLVASLLQERPHGLARLQRRLGRSPVVQAGPWVNRTRQHVDTSRMTRRAASRIAASGRLRIASQGTPADLLLLGELDAAHDRATDSELRSYWLSLSLLDVVTGEKPWIGLVRVRKLVRHQPGAPASVELLPAGRPVDLSGRFNDHDARTIARGLARDLRHSALIRDQRHGQLRLRLHRLRDRTGEQVPTRFVTLEFERSLVRLPGVVLLGRPDELARIRAQHQPAAQRGQELGATHVLTGVVTVADQGASRRYQVALEAVQVDSNAKDWLAIRSMSKVHGASARW